MPGAPAATHVSTASSTLGTAPPRELRSVATLLTLTDSADHALHLRRAFARTRFGDLLGPRLDRRLILALDHDAQQRLGAGVAHEHAAAAVERGFDARDGRLTIAGTSSTGVLLAHAHVDERLRIASPARPPDPPARARVSAITRSTASAVARPSPVGRCSARITWPDCSPPSTKPPRSISSITYLSPTGVRIILMPVLAQRDLEADVAHHGRDDRVARSAGPAR